MEKENIHIGMMIKARMKEMRLSPTEFAKRLGYSLPGTTSIFERHTMQTDVLLKVCKALEYDFFKHYRIEEDVTGGKGQGAGEKDSSTKLKMTREEEEQKKLQEKNTEGEKEIAELKKELEYLKKIVRLYEEKGK